MYTKIIFGNGTNGRKLVTNSPVYCTYRVGGGTVGNMGIGKVTYIYDDFAGSDSIETITNAVVASGGIDFESVETARVLAPKLYSTLNRAVTSGDFCAIAESVQGVAKATLVETFDVENNVYLYIVPSDYGVPSEELKALVKSTIEEIMVLNCKLTVFATEYVYYDVDVTVEVLPTQSNTDKQAEIDTYLTGILNPSYYAHGESISTSYIMGATHSITGVKKSAVNAYILDATPLSATPSVTPSDELVCTATQFLILNELTVVVTGGI